jgi:hypothetical protein
MNSESTSVIHQTTTMSSQLTQKEVGHSQDATTPISETITPSTSITPQISPSITSPSDSISSVSSTSISTSTSTSASTTSEDARTVLDPLPPPVLDRSSGLIGHLTFAWFYTRYLASLLTIKPYYYFSFLIVATVWFVCIFFRWDQGDTAPTTLLNSFIICCGIIFMFCESTKWRWDLCVRLYRQFEFWYLMLVLILGTVGVS